MVMNNGSPNDFSSRELREFRNSVAEICERADDKVGATKSQQFFSLSFRLETSSRADPMFTNRRSP